MHPQPPPAAPPDSPPHVPNGPLVVPEVPAFLRGGAAMTGGGPPSPPPLLTTFGRPRPLDPRVEQLRGRRAPKAVAAPAVRGRNGFTRPRRVTFLVEPFPAGRTDAYDNQDDDEDDDELSVLTRGDDLDHHDHDDQEAAVTVAAGDLQRPSLRHAMPDPGMTTGDDAGDTDADIWERADSGTHRETQTRRGSHKHTQRDRRTDDLTTQRHT